MTAEVMAASVEQLTLRDFLRRAGEETDLPGAVISSDMEYRLQLVGNAFGADVFVEGQAPHVKTELGVDRQGFGFTTYHLPGTKSEVGNRLPGVISVTWGGGHERFYTTSYDTSPDGPLTRLNGVHYGAWADGLGVEEKARLLEADATRLDAHLRHLMETEWVTTSIAPRTRIAMLMDWVRESHARGQRTSETFGSNQPIVVDGHQIDFFEIEQVGDFFVIDFTATTAEGEPYDTNMVVPRDRSKQIGLKLGHTPPAKDMLQFVGKAMDAIRQQEADGQPPIARPGNGLLAWAVARPGWIISDSRQAMHANGDA